MSENIPAVARRLHHLAEWVAVFGLWLEPATRTPNDDDVVPATRTITLDADGLEHFLDGLRLLGPDLEQIARCLDDEVVVGPRLKIIAGGKA